MFGIYEMIVLCTTDIASIITTGGDGGMGVTCSKVDEGSRTKRIFNGNGT